MTRSVYSIIFLALPAESYVLPSAPESAIVRRNEIPSLLYHATCADVLEAIRQGSANGRLDLMPARKLPDEYSWSGGFYLTPNEADARAFSAVYRASRCKARGGLVISEATFDSSQVRTKFVGNTDKEAKPFWNDQRALGQSIRTSFDLPRLTGDDTDTMKTPAEIADMRANPTQNKVPGRLWPVYDDFMQYDVIFGAIDLSPAMKALINGNAKYYPEITQGIVKGIDGPFPQVVLVTDADRPLNANKEVESTGKPPSEAYTAGRTCKTPNEKRTKRMFLGFMSDSARNRAKDSADLAHGKGTIRHRVTIHLVSSLDKPGENEPES
ncbi:hypothetical protein B0H13DRAFT_1918273 [Mycena leptocephala]|nr:hypothetical protein B0H13DRAFT_1918273 [Mycena leptocephala]